MDDLLKFLEAPFNCSKIGSLYSGGVQSFFLLGFSSCGEDSSFFSCTFYLIITHLLFLMKRNVENNKTKVYLHSNLHNK